MRSEFRQPVRLHGLALLIFIYGFPCSFLLCCDWYRWFSLYQARVVTT
uniref:Uncharacterized protein n=1 Tax=Aegilops tauschii subsp. strangulata TaxID=200361 RepID=A0A453PCL9_AEGTS